MEQTNHPGRDHRIYHIRWSRHADEYGADVYTIAEVTPRMVSKLDFDNKMHINKPKESNTKLQPDYTDNIERFLQLRDIDAPELLAEIKADEATDNTSESAPKSTRRRSKSTKTAE